MTETNMCIKIRFDYVYFMRDNRGDHSTIHNLHFNSIEELNDFVSGFVESEWTNSSSRKKGEYIYVRNLQNRENKENTYIECKLFENKSHLLNNFGLFTRKCMHCNYCQPLYSQQVVELYSKLM